MPNYRMHLMLCAGTGCVANKSFDVQKALETELKKQNLQDEIKVVMTGCQGFCAQGPIMIVQPENIYYQMLSTDIIPGIVAEHFLKGRPVKEHIFTPPEDDTPIPLLSDIKFFGKQKLVALANRALIDPDQIDEYIGIGGYKALAKCLTGMTRDEVIKEILDSGLRGRGGAGFPTGLKWQFANNSPGDEKYVICNADEGDPGAFMDRSIVESDPHAVLEGMLIGAYAIGANHGFIYVRDEYPLAVQRMLKAIEDAKGYGLIGEDIFDTDFCFDIEVARGAGAFVCGEETSLIGSLEGWIPEPRVRPPFPAVSGYKGKPTNINNVETWATIRHIINNGSQWFSSIGTDKSKGTKVFSLVGKINNTGLVEVPMGISVREIIYDIGGGVPDGKKFKAVQTGGPSGGCIPESLLDTSMDYESLAKVGSIVGSGGMIVMDEDNCMVEVARYFLSFTQEESCGKCTPCREGTRHMQRILTNITEGKGKAGDIEILENMARLIKSTALCALGSTAPNPVLTTIRYFRSEYEAHIRDGKCPAKECKAFIRYSIDKEKCTGCTVCAKNCPVTAIEGEKKQPHIIDEDKCIKCGICKNVCNFDAVRVDT